MFAQVKLLHGFPEPLWYQVPAEHASELVPGAIVRVPIRNKVTAAVVLSTHELLPELPFAVKSIIGFEKFPQDPIYHSFVHQLAQYHQVDPLHFIKRIRQFVAHEKAIKPLIEPADVPQEQAVVTLTDEQKAVCDFITPRIINPTYTPTLLHGITGSGKTEVYKQLILQTYAQGKITLLLLPEVTLAIQFYKLLRAQLPAQLPIFNFHSAASTKEKRQLWQHLIEGKPALIIGVHLPILLPIPNLGLILVDEEHEVGYQEKKHPKVQTKDAAIWRAQLAQIPIVLGSATPSISSMYNVHSKGWHFFQLTKRFAGALPTIKTVILIDKKQRRSFWISQPLEHAIKDRLQKKEQIIIFLNRRGYSFFVQCKACSFIFTCNNCSVSLTLHNDARLACHYCGFTMQHPPACPQCKTTDFLNKGIGTQQIVTVLEKLFPTARIGRADLDTTTKKKVWEATLKDFEEGNLDILVGTQTITKGFHFPRVTLVGIIWADLNVHFPIYNASETALQQLIQVAGRAGRQSHESLVIVQAMQDHTILRYVYEQEYLKFYEAEIATRQEVRYPPFIRLVEIELKNTNEKTLEADAQLIAQALQDAIEQQKLSTLLLGPAKPPVHTIAKIHVRKIYLKSNGMKELVELYKAIDTSKLSSQIYFTPNPLH